MLVVNLYGGPGVGKSTIQADVFRRLKQAGINAEIMTEYAKLLTWEERWPALACQPLIFGKNLYEMTILRDKVDVLVLDSPLLFSALYGAHSALTHPQSFFDAVADFSAQFETIDYLLRRVVAYDTNGRRQNAEQSDQVHLDCVALLERYSIPYTELPGDTRAGDRIFNDVLNRLPR